VADTGSVNAVPAFDTWVISLLQAAHTTAPCGIGLPHDGQFGSDELPEGSDIPAQLKHYPRLAQLESRQAVPAAT